jgi:hypothetical protein
MLRIKYGFTDSEIASFSHERELRAERAPPPPAPGEKAWELLRSQSNLRDKTLTTLAKAWRDSLPAESQPRVLCERYPRIANRLALCWSDPVLTDAVMRDLLAPRRSGRKGFPEEVRCELVVLQAAAM